MIVVDRAFVVPPIAVSLKPRTKLAIERDPIPNIFWISTNAFPPDPSQSFALVVSSSLRYRSLARDLLAPSKYFRATEERSTLFRSI